MKSATPAIDWTRPEAVFSLCCHAGWTAGDLARRLGLTLPAVTAWWRRGCLRPARWGPALDRLAKKAAFGPEHILPDLRWTPARLRRAWEASGLTQPALARACGLTLNTLARALSWTIARIINVGKSSLTLIGVGAAAVTGKAPGAVA